MCTATSTAQRSKVTVEEKKDRNNLFFFPGDPPHRVDSHSFASLVAAGYCSVNMQWNASWGCLRVLSTALSTLQVWCELDLHPITNACIFCAVPAQVWGMKGGKERNKISVLVFFFSSRLQNLICQEQVLA